jgi:uncharacterized protein (DUF433 family)
MNRPRKDGAPTVTAGVPTLYVTCRYSLFERAESVIVEDPETMRGTPVYRGTRIPVELIADMLKQGARVDEILEGYPALDREKIEFASLYVQAFPRRGRPSSRPWAKRKASR